MNSPSKIRVLIVDDSAFVRRMVRDVLSTDRAIEVVGAAADPYEAKDLIEKLSPDVLTLDLEMPRMDGLTFLGLLMERRPLPVVIMSSLTTKGSEYALEALRLGAVEVIGKPEATPAAARDLAPQLISRVKSAARAKVRGSSVALRSQASAIAPRALSPRLYDPRAAILLGASTGGVETLRDILTALPGDLPGIAIVQHIPALFSRTFAERLNTLCALEVREAVDGEALLPGCALIAPGGYHLLLDWTGRGHQVRVIDGPQVWHQRPAVDLLFKSVAESGVAAHVVAGVLTGMGQDGAAGLLRLREKGAATFAQDEATSIVYGMPKAARENGAAQTILPLDRIAGWINHHRLLNPAPSRTAVLA